MSFDQDPIEHADISGTDLAMMVDEMTKQRALIRQLGFALIEAWPMVHQPLTSDTRKKEVERAMFAFRDWCGPADQPGMLPTLSVDRFNPWKDTIEIEGVIYSGKLFREGGFGGVIGKSFRIVSRDGAVVTVAEKSND